MISRDVEIVDINPLQWRNLCSIWKAGSASGHPAQEPNVLSILHDNGTVLQTYVPEGCRFEPLQRIDDPLPLAEKLFHQYPGLDAVQIMEKTSLKDFSSKLQQCDWPKLSFDDFYFYSHSLAAQDPAGLCVFPARTPGWRGFPLHSIRSWLETLPNPSAVFLGVCRDGEPWFSLILKLVERKIQMITTMEYFLRFTPDAGRLPATPADLPLVAKWITDHIAPLSAAILCEYTVMETLLDSSQKSDTLLKAVAAHKAASIGLLPTP